MQRKKLLNPKIITVEGFSLRSTLKGTSKVAMDLASTIQPIRERHVDEVEVLEEEGEEGLDDLLGAEAPPGVQDLGNRMEALGGGSPGGEALTEGEEWGEGEEVGEGFRE